MGTALDQRLTGTRRTLWNVVSVLLLLFWSPWSSLGSSAVFQSVSSSRLPRVPSCIARQGRTINQPTPLTGRHSSRGSDSSQSSAFNKPLLDDDNEIDQRHRLRFAGVGRLYADPNDEANTVKRTLSRLQKSTVAVIGLGGVSSWAAEALCRSGIGSLILIDLDDICISNTNRQLHALSSSVGQLKIEAMKSRLSDINPLCNVTTLLDFVTIDNVDSILSLLLSSHIDVLLDAIDGSKEKSALLATCADQQVPVVTCGGAAGRVDPTKIVVQDLVDVMGDPLLSTVRKNLRKRYGFPPGLSFHDLSSSSGRRKKKAKRWNIDCVYSVEKQKQLPSGGDSASSLRRCDGALGTACFVTGTVGFVAAARVIDMIANGKKMSPPTR